MDQQNTQPNQQTESSSWKAIAIIGGVIAVVIIAILAFLLTQQASLTQQVAPAEQQPQVTSGMEMEEREEGQTGLISDDKGDMSETRWNKHTQPRYVEYFSGFTLYFPEGWYVMTDVGEEEPKSLTADIKNENDETVITISQGAGSEPACLFPEDADEVGMFSRYGEYIEIQKEGTVWRLAEEENGDGSERVVCEKSDDGTFVPGTSIGWIRVNNLAETDEETVRTVLEKIEIEGNKMKSGSMEYNVYEDVEFGISFSYPEGKYVYNYVSYNENKLSLAVSDLENPSDMPLRVSPEGHDLVQITVFRGEEFPISFQEGNGPVRENETMRSVTINGYTGKQGITRYNPLGGEDSDQTFLEIPNGGGYVYIARPLNGEEDYQLILDTINLE